jgi:hypothetical protein
MRARRHRVPDEAALEALRELYGALGPGGPLAVARVFAGDGSPASERWCSAYHRDLCRAADELCDRSLFALPPGWQLTRAELRRLAGEHTRRGDRLAAAGVFFCRPRSGGPTERFPFLHVWRMCAGRALRFESQLDGIALRRAGSLAGCPPRY